MSRRKPPALDLVDAGEVADLLGVQRRTVTQWLHRGTIVPPATRVGGRPAWRRDEVLEWARETGREVTA